MPWQYTNPDSHECSKPNNISELKMKGIGSIWQCDECEKNWVFKGFAVSVKAAAGEIAEWKLHTGPIPTVTHARYR